MKTWQPTQDPAWILEQEGFNPSQEREMESLFSIGNGYLGVRGSSVFLIPTSQADLFIAGVYDKKVSNHPYSEPEFLAQKNRDNPFSEIVPFPFPFRLEIRLDGSPLQLISPDLVSHSRILDLRQGLYFENYSFNVLKNGKLQNRSLRIRSLRCVSLADPHLLIQEIEIHSENYAGLVEIDVTIKPQEEELAFPHLNCIETVKPISVADLLVYETLASGMSCCVAARLSIDGIETNTTSDSIAITPGRVIRIRKYISVWAENKTELARDRALTHVGARSWEDFDRMIASHCAEWKVFWEQADIKFQSAHQLTHAQRFNLYHLRIPAHHSSKTSIGARALTGRAYEGHVFWDTAIFIFPFYLYTDPEIARDLILYRYNTLDGARTRAKGMGYSGACYAWESTLTGEDVTPHSIVIKGTNKEIPIFTGTQQIHVTADIAYSVWRYWDATLDEDFLARFGAEILVETARFWVSRVKKEGLHFHIHNIIGPDEYHFNVKDNAYTNWMARFNLEKAAWTMEWLRKHRPDHAEDLSKRIRLSENEIPSWKNIAHSMTIPKSNPQGVLEQFDGFFNLKDVAVPNKERMRAPISRLFAWEEINRMKLVKQADVLMIPFLFPESFSTEDLAANYHYYEPITDHGSSLSPCVHAAIAARIGQWDQAQEYWDKSLNFDLRNTMHNTPLGIHVGCMGGTWQALVFHILGIRLTPNGPVTSSDPWLPKSSDGVDFKLFYRGKSYPFRISSQRKVAA